MSNQFFRKYMDIVNEAEQVDEIFGLGKKSDSAPEGDINSVAAKLKFVQTTKKPKAYRYIDNAIVDGPMPPMSYGVNKQGQVLITTYTSDGKETQNTAEPGDIVMSGPSGEKYVIKGKKKFDKLYTGEIGNTVTSEQSPRTVALYKGKPMSFTAPWGEQMIIKPGDWLVKDGDQGYYRIAKKEFEQTYNVPK